MRFHVNMETGNVNECQAQPGHCPLRAEDGSEPEHYPDRSSAQQAYENVMHEALFHGVKGLSVNQATRRMRRYISGNPVLSRIEEQDGLLTSRFRPSDREKSFSTAHTVYRYRSRMSEVNGTDEDTVNGYRRLAVMSEIMEQMEIAASSSEKGRSGRLEKYITRRFEGITTQPLNASRTRDPDQEKEFNRAVENSRRLLEGSQKVRTEEGREVSFDRALVGTDDDGERIHLSAEARRTIRTQIRRNGDDLMEGLRNRIPSSRSSRAPEGFTFLAAGVEGNVYLHEKSMIVYKVPHQQNEYVRQEKAERGNMIEGSRKFNTLTQRALQEAGRPPKGYKYLPTFPITAGEKKIGVTAQPYMDPTRFEPHRIGDKDKKVLTDQGFCDLHEENVRMDMSTGTVYMHDCLTWEKYDIWDSL